MKTFVVRCDIHGEYEIEANSRGLCPKLCQKIEAGKCCGLILKRVYEPAPVIYKGDGFTKRVSK